MAVPSVVECRLSRKGSEECMDTGYRESGIGG